MSLVSWATSSTVLSARLSAAGAVLDNPAIDVGAVLEYYPAPHWTLRFDAGNTVVFLQDNIVGSDGKPLKRTDNFQPGLSVMYTF